MGKTLFDKLWDSHVIKDLGDGWALLHIDRHLLHDLSGAPALRDVATRKIAVHSPELAFATPDHAVSSTPSRSGTTFEGGARLYEELKARAAEGNIRFFDIGQAGQGIVHVTGPEQGIVLPGLSVVCGDSHTCTNGGLGALAFGIGSSECNHVLATQTIRQRKPKRMRILFEGSLGDGVTAKDIILHTIGMLGAAAGTGYAIEFAGPVIQQMEVESRLTMCNLAVELGARFGIVAPDEKTFAYLRGRPYAPSDEDFDTAVQYWRSLASDADSEFDTEVTVDAAGVVPTVTWGTSPEHAIGIDRCVPDPSQQPDVRARDNLHAALEYMGLQPGQPIEGTKVDWVFIGSCANSRLSDLRDAARVVRNRKVAPGVIAWVVPGSELVKRMAEAEGLKKVFVDAGFQWRQPGCSMCVGANGEVVPPGARCISTSNRNFVGRQGPGARTHLASPAMAAAAAIAGAITDIRRL
jgi:3-isopropylmalate/(R)-2-methylmalate dehydratase large subunit